MWDLVRTDAPVLMDRCLYFVFMYYRVPIIGVHFVIYGNRSVFVCMYDCTAHILESLCMWLQLIIVSDDCRWSFAYLPVHTSGNTLTRPTTQTSDSWQDTPPHRMCSAATSSPAAAMTGPYIILQLPHPLRHRVLPAPSASLFLPDLCLTPG